MPESGLKIKKVFKRLLHMKTRARYFLIICLIIILGLLSRKAGFIPVFAGDILYAMMIYFIMRFLFLKSKRFATAAASLLICYIIEFLQLYKAEWIARIRTTTFGHLVLGQGFLWSD